MSRIHRILALGLSHRGFRIKPTLNQKTDGRTNTRLIPEATIGLIKKDHTILGEEEEEEEGVYSI